MNKYRLKFDFLDPGDWNPNSAFQANILCPCCPNGCFHSFWTFIIMEIDGNLRVVTISQTRGLLKLVTQIWMLPDGFFTVE